MAINIPLVHISDLTEKKTISDDDYMLTGVSTASKVKWSTIVSLIKTKLGIGNIVESISKIQSDNYTLKRDLTYKKIASNIPSSTKYTIPSEYKMAILVATINYPNAISPQFTFMFPNLTETKRISDGYWYDNTYHASFMACNDGNVVYFASNWQVVSPTGTVTYDVYAR